MPLIGAVADDLTGATTTGVLLARSKARTAVFFNEEAAQKAGETASLDAILISSNSRPLPKEEAYEKVKSAANALKAMGVKYFSKRIDTTLRGGVGVEVDAMLDQLNEDTVAVVVPAMPQSRRILVGGYSVIDGVALINTPVAQDVRTPVKENYIPRLLAGQTRRKVGLVTLDQVLKGKEGIREALTEVRNDGAGVIIVDAITLEDVDQIAQACIELDWDVVAVDPGPFTSKLAYRRGLIQEEQPNIPPAASEEGKTVLIAAGSATPVTKKQMEVLCEDSRHVRISVEPIPLINGGDEALDEAFKAVNKAVELIESGEQPRAILFETALHGELLNLDEEDKKRGYAGGMSANRINAGLGTIISQVLEQVGRERIAGLYTTGGDTMVNVCYATDTGAISILSLNDGPFFTLIALGATGLANIPIKSLIAVLVPLLIGFFWGNLDKGFRDACKTAQPIVTFFMTISIGAKTDVKTILTAGASGIVLGLISAATAVIFFFVINLLLPKKERNAMGAAIGTTALNSAMTPAAVAEADPSMEGMVSMATAQCATASIITLFLCPFITAAFDKWMQKRQKGIYSPEGWAYDRVKAN